jgi:hypothetical protein
MRQTRTLKSALIEIHRRKLSKDKSESRNSSRLSDECVDRDYAKSLTFLRQPLAEINVIIQEAK